MALGKYSRVEGRKSSNCCSTISVVVFVAFCLVGIWVFMSSTVPVQDQEELTSDDALNDVMKRQVVSNKYPKHFEDSSDGESQTSKESQEETPRSVEVESSNDSDEKTDESERSESEEVREENGDETKQISEADQENVEQTQEKESDSHENTEENKAKGDNEASELLEETKVEKGGWSTQAVESQNEKRLQHDSVTSNSPNGGSWKLCNVTAGPDYIPCLDNWEAIRNLPSTKHYEHRERHCPDEPPTCLVRLPEGYKRPVEWPTSRDKVGQFV